MTDTQHLRERGYCITSRRYHHATRIDQADWASVCQRGGYPINADWYRRVLSKDKVTVTVQQLRELPNSINGPQGYLP